MVLWFDHADCQIGNAPNAEPRTSPMDVLVQACRSPNLVQRGVLRSYGAFSSFERSEGPSVSVNQAELPIDARDEHRRERALTASPPDRANPVQLGAVDVSVVWS